MSSEGESAAEEAVNHLRQAIVSGKHWYVALLEAIGLWTAPEEKFQEEQYKYIVAGEAFDWLLLARRLCDAVDGLIPQTDKDKLLLEMEPPIELSTEDFRELIGSAKYRALLNYWYGVNVEQALLSAVEKDIHKERMAAGLPRRRDVSQEAHRRIYGFSKKALLKAFHKEKKLEDDSLLSQSQLKEFTYWLFKLRLAKHDKARVASDTKRGIVQLQAMARQRSFASTPPYDDPDKIIDLSHKPF